MTEKLTHPIVKAAIDALQAGDSEAWQELFDPDAVLLDDGRPRDLERFSDEAVGHERFASIDTVRDGGLKIEGEFQSDVWVRFRTCFCFTISDEGKIAKLEIGHALSSRQSHFVVEIANHNTHMTGAVPLESKVIFITGVSTGLGRALAEEALSAGYHVASTARDGQAVEAFETLAPGRAPALTYSIYSHEWTDRHLHSQSSILQSPHHLGRPYREWKFGDFTVAVTKSRKARVFGGR